MSNVAQGDISWLATIDDDTSETSPPTDRADRADRELPSRRRPDWVTGPWTATDPPARTTGRADGGPEGVWICGLVPERSVGERLVGHDARVTAVTTALVGGRPVVVAGTAGWGATVRVFDLDRGRQVCRPLVGRTAWVGAARATVAGRPVAVTGDSAGVRVWDPATGLPVGEPLIGSVRAVATAELDGRPVAIVGPETARNGDADNAVRVIDLATGAEFGAPLTGHSRAVTGVATAVVHGRPVAVTGSRQAARVWDLLTREPIGAPLAADVSAVATGLLAGRPIVVAGGSTGASGVTAPTAPTIPTGERGTVQVWDLTTHTPIGPRLLFPLPVGALTVAPGGRVVVAFGRELAVLRHD
ncbi:WD40 repeat domain-containing protein [Embleya sp. NPDC020630]|uniref:WD40 repeat domain-containing protein n=1 Tax=Embleya sp. NPDC020630 TaxID=3363979 RepID=UPI0037981D60